MNSHQKIVSRVLAALDAGDLGNKRAVDREALLWRISDLPDDSATYFSEALYESDERFPDEATLIQVLVYMLVSNAPLQDVEDTIHLCLIDEMVYERLYDVDAWDREDHFPLQHVKEIITGLRRYKGITGFDYDNTVAIRRQGQKIIEQCEALVCMAEYLEYFHEYQYENGVMMVHDPDMAELTVEYPDKIGVIMEMINFRSDDSAFPIREVISGNVHSSLGDGVI